MSVREYLGKFYYQCLMCTDLSFTEKYKWIGDITEKELTICAKCAKREIGGKKWQIKSQRLKKLKQK